MEATGVGGVDGEDTVTVALPDFPSLVAVIVAVPALRPLTRPSAATLAIAGWLEFHVIARSVRRLPEASFKMTV